MTVQDHGLEKSLDHTTLIPACQDAIEHAKPVELSLPIRNVNRTVGTTLGYEITRRWSGDGLPDDTIKVHFRGSAGQSFGAFVPRGVSFTLEGDANDYWGKGLSGGRLVVCTQCAARRDLTAADLVAGATIAGAASFVEAVLTEGVQALVY